VVGVGGWGLGVGGWGFVRLVHTFVESNANAAQEIFQFTRQQLQQGLLTTVSPCVPPERPNILHIYKTLYYILNYMKY
jgi:hypothetical protein